MPDDGTTLARGKVIGRILSLGFPLPGAQVDNYTFLSAPAFFDYDAIVVDPHALSLLIDGVADGSVEATTFSGRAVRTEPAAPGDARLADVLMRRRGETEALLRNGGFVVCFVYPPTEHRGVTGASAIDDYFWLPLPDGVSMQPPLLVAGEGSQAQVVDFQHPLAAFLHAHLASIAYRAHFDAREAPAATVFARSRGGAAIAVELPLPHGRVVFLPALTTIPAGEARYAMSDALQMGIRRALGLIAEGRPPYWLSRHDLTGLDERAQARDAAREAFDAAQAALDGADAAYDEVAKYQRLLWQEGAVGLDGVVLDALKLIGFDVYNRDRTDIELRCGGVPVLIEIEASEREIDLAPHHRLRQRIERAIERRGIAPRALILVNGVRLEPPASRPRQVTDAARLAAETMRYCIAPTSTLFEAVAAKLRGDDAAVEAYRQRLMSHHGVLD